MIDEIRRPSESLVALSQAMSITDANLAGNVHGGVIMKLCDTAAGLAAVKHCRSRVVTVAMDEMVFIEPVYLSDVVTLRAQVNDVGRTSMVVPRRSRPGSRVRAWRHPTGLESRSHPRRSQNSTRARGRRGSSRKSLHPSPP